MIAISGNSVAIKHLWEPTSKLQLLKRELIALAVISPDAALTNAERMRRPFKSGQLALYGREIPP